MSSFSISKRIMALLLCLVMLGSMIPGSAMAAEEGTPAEELEHTHSWDEVVITDQPTCGEDGEKIYTCTVCGETKNEAIPMTGGHVWDDGTVISQPTCGEDGVKTYTCTVCGETKNEAIPMTGEHRWDEGKVTAEPTETEKGEKLFTCPACGTTRTEEIAVLKHDEEATPVQRNSVSFLADPNAVAISVGGMILAVTDGAATAEAENGTIVFSLTVQDNYTLNSVMVDGTAPARHTTNPNTGAEEPNQYIIEGIATNNTVVTIDTVKANPRNNPPVLKIVRPGTETADIYEFYNGSELLRTQTVVVGASGSDTLFAPAAPAASASGGSFIGWYVGDTKLDFNADNQCVITEATTGKTVRVEAKFAEQYSATFYDQSDRVFSVIVVNEGEQLDITGLPEFICEQNNQSLAGWTEEKGSSTAAEFPTDISENVFYYPIIQEGYYLRFDANRLPEMSGVNVTYTAPQFITGSGVTAEPDDPIADNRAFTFKGWYADAACTTPFVFGQSLTEDTIVYAGWNIGTAEYHIYIWLQKESDTASSSPKNYDYVTSFTGVEDIGAVVMGNDVIQVNMEKLQDYNYEVAHYTIEGAVRSSIDNSITVSADGSSILNIYYDRELRTINFYRNGEKVDTFEGLYGQSFSQVGKAWPAGVWKDENGNTIAGLSAFTSSESVLNLYADDTSATRNVVHVRKTGDVWAEADTIGVGDGAITVSDMYSGYRVVGYGASISDAPGTPISDGGTIPSGTGTVYVFHEPEEFPLEFYDGTAKLVTRSVPYSEVLDGYKPDDLSPSDPDQFTFGGWADHPNEHNAKNALDLTAETMPAGTKRLYAVWVPLAYNVKLNANGGELPEGQLDSFWPVYGDLLNGGNVINATRAGYILTGWYAQDGTPWDFATGVSKDHADDNDHDGEPDRNYDSEYENYYYTITLTAHWKKTGDVKLRYDVSGDKTVITDGNTYSQESTATISTSIPAPPADKVFVGWQDKNGTIHTPGSSILLTEDLLSEETGGIRYLDLTAIFEDEKEVPRAKIRYHGYSGETVEDDNGGSGYSWNEMTNLKDEDTFTRENYVLSGWSKTENGEKDFDLGEEVYVSALKSDHTDEEGVNHLYAVWKQAQQVHYEITGDVRPDPSLIPPDEFHAEGETVTAAAAPSVVGYHFVGWSSADVTISGNSFTMPDHDVTLTGSYEPNQITVTKQVNLNGVASDRIDTTVYFGLRYTDSAGNIVYLTDKNGNPYIIPVSIIDGVPQSTAVFTEVPEGTYSVYELKEDSSSTNPAGYSPAIPNQDTLDGGLIVLARISTSRTGEPGDTSNNVTVNDSQGTDVMTVTNHYANSSDTIEWHASKIWCPQVNNILNQNNTPPENAWAIYELYKNGEPTGYTIRLDGVPDEDENPGWTAVFKNLEKVSDEIKYSVKEIDYGYTPDESSTYRHYIPYEDTTSIDGGNILNVKMYGEITIVKNIIVNNGLDTMYIQDPAALHKVNIKIESDHFSKTITLDEMEDQTGGQNRYNAVLQYELKDMPAGRYTITESGYENIYAADGKLWVADKSYVGQYPRGGGSTGHYGTTGMSIEAFLSSAVSGGSSSTGNDQIEIRYTNHYDKGEGFGTLKLQKSFHNLPEEYYDRLSFRITGPEYPNGIEIPYSEFVNGIHIFNSLAVGEYTIEEINANSIAPGYVVKVDVETTKTVIVQKDDSVTVSFDNDYETGYGTLAVRKFLVDNTENKIIPSDKEFRFTVKNSAGKYMNTDGTYSDDRITHSIKNNQTIYFSNLPLGEYTVEEENAEVENTTWTLTVGGDASADGKVTVHRGTQAKADLTNTYEDDSVPEGNCSLKIIKTVYGNGAPVTGKKFYVTVKVVRADSGVTAYVQNTNGKIGSTPKLIEIAAGTTQINNLPEGYYTVTEDVSAAEIYGYRLSVTYDYGTGPSGEWTNLYPVTKKVDQYNSGVFNVTNTYTTDPEPDSDKIHVTVKKLWYEDGSPVDEPDEDSATVQLVRYQAEKTTTTLHFIGITKASEEVPKGAEVTIGTSNTVHIAANSTWFSDWISNPWKIRDQGILIAGNPYGDTLTSLKFDTGNYNDVYVYFIENPGSVSVSSNGGEIPSPDPPERDASYSQTAVLNTDNNWTWTFANLPVSGEGNWYSYAVEETAPSSGYTTTYKVDGGDWKNTLAPEDAVGVAGSHTINVKNEKELPTFGNLVIRKTVSGLDASSLPGTLTFTVTGPEGFTTRTIQYSEMTDGSITLEDVPLGTYQVKETVSTAQVAQYTLTATTYSTKDSTDTTGKAELTQTAPDGEVTVHNAYEKKTVSVTLTKTFSGIENLPSGFKITTKSDDPNFNGLEFTPSGLTPTENSRTGAKTYTWTVENVPVGTEIQFVESGYGIQFYDLTATPADFKMSVTAAEGGTNRADFNNIYQRQTTSLKVKKLVEGQGAIEENRPFGFRLTLSEELPADYPLGKRFSYVEGNRKILSFTLWPKEELPLEIPSLPIGIDYSIEEIPSENYSLTKVEVNGVVITGQTASGTLEADTIPLVQFTNTRDSGSLTIAKVWTGDTASLTDEYKNAVKFTITGPNSYSEEVLYSEFTDGSYTLSDLTLGTYTVTETNTALEGYTVTTTYKVGDQETGTAEVTSSGATVTVTNDYDKQEGSLTVTKTWAGEHTKLTEAQKNAVAFTVTGPNSYITEFTYADMTNGSKTLWHLALGEYTVTESNNTVSGFTIVTKYEVGDSETNKVSIADGDSKTVAVTNTVTEQKGGLTIAKVWTGDTASLTDEYKNAVKFTITGPNSYSEEVPYSKFTDGSYTLSDLTLGTYTVTETNTALDGYEITTTYKVGDQETGTAEVTSSGATVTVTNDYNKQEGSLTVTKTWAGEHTKLTEAQKNAVTFTVTGPNSYITEFTYTDMTNGSKTLEHLALGEYTVTESNNTVSGFTIVTKYEVGDSETNKVSIADGDSKTVAVTNTVTEQKGGLKVSKTVRSSITSDKTKEFDFKVTLSDATISGTYGDMSFTGGVATFKLKDGQSKTATGLPQGIGYTVTETASAGFLTTKTGDTGTITAIQSEAKFTNTRETLTVSVQKVWKDHWDRDKLRPQSITIRLFANGAEVGRAKVTASSDWYCEFEDLPKYDGNGKVITYSISEDAVRSYRTSITDNGNGSFTVKNYHSRGPATGDESNPALWAVIGAAALAGLIGTGVALGKKRKKETPEKNK